MIPRRLLYALVALVAFAFPAGAGRAAEVTIFASNYPIAYFAERISGQPDAVQLPVFAGDPADWRPSVDDILAIQQADVILLNGASYEAWVETATLPLWRVVVTSRAFRDRYLTAKSGVTHKHGPEGLHAHTATAFTTWLDFSLAVEQAEAVRDALAALGRFDEAALTRNYEELRDELLQLDRGFQSVGAAGAHAPLVASHPVYDYLAARYGLNIESVHWEPDEPPGVEMWAGLESLLARHRATVMIWEGAPLAETKARLKQMGLESVVFDPSGKRPTSGDLMSAMTSNLARLQAILGGGT